MDNNEYIFNIRAYYTKKKKKTRLYVISLNDEVINKKKFKFLTFYMTIYSSKSPKGKYLNAEIFGKIQILCQTHF